MTEWFGVNIIFDMTSFINSPKDEVCVDTKGAV